jgi:ribulose-phosphate 3-epimerase
MVESQTRLAYTIRMNTTRMNFPVLAPSILSADFSRISSELDFIRESGTNWVHLDVMDGHFVPNLTFGPKFISDLRKISDLIFDVHLMIEKPELSIDQYIDAGADWLTFHFESCVHSHRLLSYIKSKNIKAGISINPSSPISLLEELLPYCDQVLVMSVNPGFGGQKILPNCIKKVSDLVALRAQKGYDYCVAIDGGVNLQTIKDVAIAGPDIIVAGSAFFAAKDPAEFRKTICTVSAK